MLCKVRQTTMLSHFAAWFGMVEPLHKADGVSKCKWESSVSAIGKVLIYSLANSRLYLLHACKCAAACAMQLCWQTSKFEMSKTSAVYTI